MFQKTIVTLIYTQQLTNMWKKTKILLTFQHFEPFFTFSLAEKKNRVDPAS